MTIQAATDVTRSLRMEQQPLSPTYMAYTYNHPEPDGRTSTAHQKPYQPATQINPAAVALQDARGVYEHFHSPCNDHNKFLSSVRDDDKYAYRDLPRMAPPPFDHSGRSSIRPQSAGRSRRVDSGSPGRPATASASYHTAGMILASNNVTQTGAPCYNVSAVIPVDLQQGSPVLDAQSMRNSSEAWRLAYVQTYAVPPSSTGYGEGGKRAFHQDYRHYKYYGYAGKGAKTSWAHNPKHAQTWQTSSPSHSPSRPGSAPAARAGQPGTPLTKAQAQLVQQFKKHAYSAEKSYAPVEMLEPYTERASLALRRPLSPMEAKDRSRTDKVTVMTYRQVAPGGLTMTENPSPNHGSQAPFHQRYEFYKLNGYAGKGATSSWARNPKMALLYD